LFGAVFDQSPAINADLAIHLSPADSESPDFSGLNRRRRGPTWYWFDFINGTGQTLLPGLIDSHIHLPGQATAELTQALVFGVTSALDMFAPVPELVRQLKQEQAAGTPNRADLLSAGICVTAPSGHGTQIPIKIPTIAAPEGAQAFVDARIADRGDEHEKHAEGLGTRLRARTRPHRASVHRSAPRARGRIRRT